MARIAEEMAVVPADLAAATVVATAAVPIMAAQTGSRVQVPGEVTGARSKPGQRLESAAPLVIVRSGIVRLQIAPRSIVPLETVPSGIDRQLAIVAQRFRPAVPPGRKQGGPSPVPPVRIEPRRHALMSFGELAQPDRLLAGGRSGVGQALVQIGSVPCGLRLS